MTWYIHVNRGIIDAIRKATREGRPVDLAEAKPISVKKGRHGRTNVCASVSLVGPSVVRYDPAGILPCGAKVVIETEIEPIIQ